MTWHFSGGTKENHETPERIVGVLAEIRTEYLGRELNKYRVQNPVLYSEGCWQCVVKFCLHVCGCTITWTLPAIVTRVRFLLEARGLRSAPEQMEHNQDSIHVPRLYCLLILLPSLTPRPLRWQNREPLECRLYYYKWSLNLGKKVLFIFVFIHGKKRLFTCFSPLLVLDESNYHQNLD